MSYKSRQPYRMYSSSLDAMMREVLHMLGDIDFLNEVELNSVEMSIRDEELKSGIKEKLNAAHREKRQPYVDLVNRLRLQQHRQSLAA
jgi:hypothetical protein